MAHRTNSQFAEGIVQKNYLIQQYAISPAYAQSIYDLLPNDDNKASYTMEEVADAAPQAHMVGSNKSFASKDGRSFMGMSLPSAK